MKITRKATAVWQGSGKEGKGNISSQSGILSETNYGFRSRFEDGPGTNPEELVGAAHAGCFSMALAFKLQENGFTAETLETKAEVVLEDGKINDIYLKLSAKVPGIEAGKFKELAEEAEKNCPISQLFNANIHLSTTLNS